MVFSSVIFLWIFLPIVLLSYYGVMAITAIPEKTNHKIRNILLLVASVIFYGLGGYKYLILLAGALVINYIGGRLVAADGRRAKLWLVLTVILDLGLLFCFKYLNLFVLIYENIVSPAEGMTAADSFHNIVTLTRTGKLAWTDIVLPIGISFYIFQSISYVVDVYRKDAKMQKNFLDFSLYVAFFPQLIAGPIVKYSDVDDQIRNRKESFKLLGQGITRFIYGLAKKVLIANVVAETADTIWKLEIPGLGAGVTWLGAICYTLQIYFDFSGYSDMAIGLGKMFGFEFKENFNYPYMADSVQDFWRRWHMSLSTWFKEYVYIPLGGSREGLAKTIRNTFIVFLLTGIWHGANFTFLLWGLMYAVLLVLERLFLGKLLKKRKVPILNYVYTMFFVIMGWVLFRSNNITEAWTYIKEMFRGGNSEFTVFSFITLKLLIALIAGIALCFPIYPKYRKSLSKRPIKTKKVVVTLETIYQIILLVLSLVMIVSNSYNPFIYYQF